MDNIIDLEERKKMIKAKKEAEIKKEEEFFKLNELLSDMETILALISKGEIKEISLVFNFRGSYCYYGRDENLDLKSLDHEKMKEEVDKISKSVRFK